MSSIAILVAGPGTVTITNTRTIQGETGIKVTAADAAANAVVYSGRIKGTGETALAFGMGDDHLTVNSGATFSGTVDGGAGNDVARFTNTEYRRLPRIRAIGSGGWRGEYAVS